MPEKLVNFLIFVFVIPFLVLFLMYVVIRKLIDREWEVFSSGDEVNYSEEASIVGIPFSNLRMNEAIELIFQNLSSNRRKTYFFLNPHAVNLSKRDELFYSILSENEFNFPDGMGMKLAGIFEKYELKENLCGTDLYPCLMDMSVQKSLSVFFLGGSEEVVEGMVSNAHTTWPKLKVAGFYHGYFDKEKDSDEVVKQINAVSPDILLVSFGMPIQEKWIHNNFSELNAKAVFATGGLFDFFSGKVKRAPLVWRQIGMEWAYRLILEPKRMWKRYVIGNPLFLVHVLKDRYLANK